MRSPLPRPFAFWASTTFSGHNVTLVSAARIVVIVVTCTIAVSSSVAASSDDSAATRDATRELQQAATSGLSHHQLTEVEHWVREYNDWKVWFAKWHNRTEPGWFGTRHRRQRPDPPAVLHDACPPA